MATTDLDGVRHWVTEHLTSGWLAKARPSLEIRDTYFDTHDWRIHRAGFALRIREASGVPEATLKELRSVRNDIADRREVTETLPAASLDALSDSTGLVGTQVRSLAGTSPLRALFLIHTRRQRFGLRRGDSSDLGELALDDARITDPEGASRAAFRHVEVEATSADFADTDIKILEDFVLALCRECAVEPTADSKFSLGLKALGLTPATQAERSLEPASVSTPGEETEAVAKTGPVARAKPIEAETQAHPESASEAAARPSAHPPPQHYDLDPVMTIDTVGLAALRHNLKTWRANEPAVRVGEDPEALHDLRVAGRRMIAALNLFQSDLPAALLRIEPRLKQLVRSFSAARDLDVALQTLETFSQELEPADRVLLDPVRQHLNAERLPAQAGVRRILDAVGTQRCLARIERAVTVRQVSRHRPTHVLAVEVIPGLLQSRYRKLRKGIDRLTPESTADDRHVVRGKVKKLRYAIESVAPLYGKPAAKILRTLRRLQDRLGEEHDAHVMQQRMRTLSRRAPRNMTAEAAFLLGRMAERDAPAGGHARDQAIEKSYRQLRRRWKKLRRELDQLNTPAPPAAETASGPASPAPD